MFSNYLQIALKNLKNNLGVSAVRIFSLSVGLWCSLLIVMHLEYAFNFDKHLPNGENIYRLVTDITIDQDLRVYEVPDSYAGTLQLDYPQIESIARIKPAIGFFLKNGNAVQQNKVDFYWADPGIIDIFSLDFISGNPGTALTEPNSMVISESMAQRLFPEEDALGQTLTLVLRNETDIRISGVYKDLPENTHIDFPLLVSAETTRVVYGDWYMFANYWTGYDGTMTYLRFTDQRSAQAVSDDLGNFLLRNAPDEQQRVFVEQYNIGLGMEPLADIYLSDRTNLKNEGTNRREMLSGLGLFTVMILLTACINYGNLTFSQLQQRHREVGLRKVLGAQSSEVLLQFLSESLLFTLLAFIVVLPFVYMAVPVYTAITATAFTFSSLASANSALPVLLLLLLTGTLSGMIPALIFSRYNPARIISGLKHRVSWLRFSRPLVTIVQFTVSTSLVILTIAIYMQITFLNRSELGFNKDNLVVLDSFSRSAANPVEFNAALVNEISQHPGILSVAKSTVKPLEVAGSSNPWQLPDFGPDEYISAHHFLVDENYIATMGLELVAGRQFSGESASDFFVWDQGGPLPEQGGLYSIVITESAVSLFGFDSPESVLGELFLYDGDQYRVIGVVRDFSFRGGMEASLEAAKILRAGSGLQNILLIRIDPAQMNSALTHIDNVWADLRSGIPIDRHFFDENFNDLLYRETNGLGKAAFFASGVTIIISLLGLYALASYYAQRRKKEVGVRKVFGATSAAITRLFTWDFIKPILIACFLAWDISYLLVDNYLEQFSASVEITPLLYFAVALFTVLIAVLTTAGQCIKAANASPVLALRYE